MLILGLLLLLAAAALTAGMIVGNTGNVAFDVFGEDVTAFSIGEIFLLGVGTGIIAGLSLTLVLSGMRRSSRKRRERRAEARSKRAREQELQEENARLARELDQQRRAGGGTAPAAFPPGTQGGGSLFTRPSGPPSSAPAADRPQEGRQPLS